jgi:superfamily II DNA or RNA helicase
MTKYNLSTKGAVLKLSKLKEKKLKRIQNDLTVAPYVMDFNQEVESFELFKVGKKSLSIPRYYALSKFGKAKAQEYHCDPVDIKFSGKLREFQTALVDKCYKQCIDNGGGLLSVGCGAGKCLAKGTEVLMFDGSLKKVENIEVNDLIMGPDSKYRTVLSLANGREEMFKITHLSNIDFDTLPEKFKNCLYYMNDSYTVNRSHILSLIVKSHDSFIFDGKSYGNGKIINISVDKYLKLPDDIKKVLYGYKTVINFDARKTKINPRLFGYEWAKLQKNTNISRDFIQEYIINSIENRREVLAGIIESIGFVSRIFNNYRILTDNLEFANDLKFLGNSIGINVDIILNKFCPGEIMYYIVFSGSEIYNLTIDKEKSLVNKFLETGEMMLYKIELSYMDYGEYYGFTLDGDRRFVLGNLIVTHNTVMALNLFSRLGVKTMVVVHKSFLQDQWIQRAREFTNARIGSIRQDKIDVENKDIVIAMIQSLSMRDYDAEIFNGFGFVIYDEAHHCASKVFSRALQKTAFKYTLALTATPNRADGLRKVMHWYLGPTIYRQKKKVNRQVITKIFRFKSNNRFFKEETVFAAGKSMPSTTKMINNLVKIKERDDHIVNIINILRKFPERKTIILSNRREHLINLKKRIDESIKQDVEKGLIVDGETKTYFYIGGMKKVDRKDAEDNADILFATFSMADEGLDIDRLNTVILASPKKNIVQAVGRVMRKVLGAGDVRPLIIDICDELSVFKGQGLARIKQYQDSKYNIETYYLENDKLITYQDYKKKEFKLTDAELEEYIDKECIYEADWNKILDMAKVEEEDRKEALKAPIFDVEDIIKAEIHDYEEDEESEEEVKEEEIKIEKINFGNYLF